SSLLNVTSVGAYTGTTSPYGAFDMGGNVWEWNDTLIINAGPNTYVGLRGGSFYYLSNLMLSSIQGYAPTFYTDRDIGFRVATVPEPSSAVLAALGLIVM